MSNLVLKGASGMPVTLPDFKNNQEVNGDIRRIKVSTEIVNKKGGTWKKVYGYVIMETYSKDKYVGQMVHKLQCHFRKKAFSKAENIHTPEDIENGLIYFDVNNASIPTVYKVRQAKDKDGNLLFNEDGTPKMKFPEIWFEDDSIIGLQVFKVSQDALEVGSFQNPIDGEAETVDADVVGDEEATADDYEAIQDLSNDDTIEDID